MPPTLAVVSVDKVDVTIVELFGGVLIDDEDDVSDVTVCCDVPQDVIVCVCWVTTIDVSCGVKDVCWGGDGDVLQNLGCTVSSIGSSPSPSNTEEVRKNVYNKACVDNSIA